MNHRRGVARRDLDRGVGARSRRSADEQRQPEALALHLGRDVGHLFQGWSDQAGQPDNVHLLGARLFQDPGSRNHDPQVHDLVVIARQNHTHNVLANIVDIALDGRHQDLAARSGVAGGLLLGLDERDQMCHGLLHDSGALDDLGQEHLAGREEVADGVHAGHQRAFDDIDGMGGRNASLLGILDNEGIDTFDQRVRQPLRNGQRTPG